MRNLENYNANIVKAQSLMTFADKYKILLTSSNQKK